MKIKKITAQHVQIPLKKPFHMANFVMKYMNCVHVNVETNTGIIGTGEAVPAWEVTGETIADRRTTRLSTRCR